MALALQKERVEHARMHALSQIILNPEKGKEAYDSYVKVAFPWFETQKKRERDDHVRILFEEVRKGGVSIRPIGPDPSTRSRMRARVVERTPAGKPRTREQQEAFYKKLQKSQVR